MRKLLVFCLLATILSACAAAGGPSAGTGPESQPTLTPTADALGYLSVASRSCLVADWSAIQTDRSQGDMIAWRPDTYQIAYLAPSATTNWYTGVISLASGTGFQDRKPLSETALASGDITWSPDGARLAFLAFRVDESLETVLVLTPGQPPVDLFPLDTARTDARTSQKSILNWLDPDRVRVIASCGEDCQQQIDFDTSDGSSTPAAATQRKNANALLDRSGIKVIDGLSIQQKVLEYDPEAYPRGFNRPNWSPDGSQVVYLDRRGLLWLLNLEDQKQWILDIGLRVVNETKWSSDGRLLAVRAEDRVYIIEVQCSQPGDAQSSAASS